MHLHACIRPSNFFAKTTNREGSGSLMLRGIRVYYLRVFAIDSEMTSLFVSCFEKGTANLDLNLNSIRIYKFKFKIGFINLIKPWN